MQRDHRQFTVVLTLDEIELVSRVLQFVLDDGEGQNITLGVEYGSAEHEAKEAQLKRVSDEFDMLLDDLDEQPVG